MEALNAIQKEITIPGLKNTYRILHVTDVHIVLWDKHDEETLIVDNGPHGGKRLVADFGVKREKVFTAADGVTTNARFAELCDRLREGGTAMADAVVFTGDILDFYTDAAFDFMVENLNKLPMPYLFVPGNHDYIFSNRTEEIVARFAKLCGGSFHIQKLKLGELTLVGAHNGEYFYEDETFSRIAEAIRGEEHVLLCQHVPINSSSLEEYSTQSGKKCNYAIGGADCPDKGDSYERIMALIRAEDSPVRALLCGDAHYNYGGPLTDTVMQYVSPLLRDFAPVCFTVKGS